MFDGGPLPLKPIEPWRSFKEKLEQRTKLNERLKAFAAFSGIAIGAVAGFEMVIGGGFDAITPAPEVREVAPSRFVTVHQVPWSSQLQVIPLSSTEPLFAGEAIEVERASDRLAGGYDDSSLADIAAFPDIGEQEIRRQIDVLYRSPSGPTYREASIVYEDAPAIDEQRAADSAPDPYAEAEDMVRQALRDHDALHPS